MCSHPDHQASDESASIETSSDYVILPLSDSSLCPPSIVSYIV